MTISSNVFNFTKNAILMYSFGGTGSITDNKILDSVGGTPISINKYFIYLFLFVFAPFLQRFQFREKLDFDLSVGIMDKIFDWVGGTDFDKLFFFFVCT